MNELLSKLLNYILFASFPLLMLVVFIRFLFSRLGATRTVKAKVIHKQKNEVFSRHSGSGKAVECCVIFEANGKHLSFRVSEFSYGGYRLHEKGTLTCKGKKLISFR